MQTLLETLMRLVQETGKGETVLRAVRDGQRPEPADVLRVLMAVDEAVDAGADLGDLSALDQLSSF